MPAFSKIGVIYGWMSLELIFNREGTFAWKCNSTPATPTSTTPYPNVTSSTAMFFLDPTTPTLATTDSSCAARNSYLTSIYTVGVSANIASYVVWGIILDSIGPRFTSVCSISLALLGNILFAIANDTSRNVFHVAAVLVGVGGIGVHLSGFHIANSAPLKYVGLASAMFPCLFNVSSVIYPLFNVFNLGGLSRASIFAGFSVIMAIAAVLEFWVQEWTIIPRPSPPELLPVPAPAIDFKDEDLNEIEVEAYKANVMPQESDLLPLEVIAVEEPGFKPLEPELTPEQRKKLEDDRRFAHLRYMPNRQSQTFLQQFISWYFLWTIIWISSVMCRNAFWQGNVARQLRSYGATNDNYAIAISWFPLLIFGLVPFLGPAIDKYGLPVIMTVGCFFQVFYTALALVPNIPIQLVTGIIAVLSRAVVMTCHFSCVAIVCSYRTFGKISGIAMAGGGLVNFTSIPLNSLINNQFKGDFFWVQVIELLWGVPLLLYPYYLWSTGRREALEANAPPAVIAKSPVARELDISSESSSNSSELSIPERNGSKV